MTNDKQRERFVEIYHNIEIEYLDYLTNIAERAIDGDIEDKIQKRQQFYVDKLLENGVIVPPCKVGQTVYSKSGCFPLPYVEISKEEFIPCEVIAIKETKKGKYILLKPLLIETYGMRKVNQWFPFSSIGKTVFPTREESEQALVNYGSSKNDVERKENEGK